MPKRIGCEFDPIMGHDPGCIYGKAQQTAMRVDPPPPPQVDHCPRHGAHVGTCPGCTGEVRVDPDPMPKDPEEVQRRLQEFAWEAMKEAQRQMQNPPQHPAFHPSLYVEGPDYHLLVIALRTRLRRLLKQAPAGTPEDVARRKLAQDLLEWLLDLEEGEPPQHGV